MSNSNQITRPHAALIHLSVSVAISAALFCFFYFVWYPSQLLRAVGGLEIFIVLLCVDTILGPLMTFVVYKPGKRWLKLDLTIICTLQFLALIYGVSTLYAGRPVYIAALGHRFDVVQANEVESIDSQDALPELPIWGPVWVGTRRPSAPAERERAINAALAGADIGHFPRYHQPLADMRDEILRGASPIADLKQELGTLRRLSVALKEK